MDETKINEVKGYVYAACVRASEMKGKDALRVGRRVNACREKQIACGRERKTGLREK